jgi:cytidine deaminase
MLLAEAHRAAEAAYAPYSGTQVGAALLCSHGHVYAGCNIEVVNLSGSICAERSALAQAISAGCRSFAYVAVVSSKMPECYPCGVCREVLAEFGPVKVLVEGSSSGENLTTELATLLPHHPHVP